MTLDLDGVPPWQPCESTDAGRESSGFFAAPISDAMVLMSRPANVSCLE